MIIRDMKINDVKNAADIHKAAFPRQNMSLEWITANFNAFPRMQYFVAEENEQIYGFIHWTQKSGFRDEVVLELEQIAVHPDYQKKGIGEKLINESLVKVNEQLSTRNAIIKHVIVTTRADNYAQKLYSKTLGAKAETIIKNLYSSDEVIMIRRNISIN